jgi:hypothetical protein
LVARTHEQGSEVHSEKELAHVKELVPWNETLFIVPGKSNRAFAAHSRADMQATSSQKRAQKKGAWGAQWGVKAELQWNVAFSMLKANF